MRRWLLFPLLVVPGLFVCVFCLYYGWQDWAALQKTYANFARLPASSTSMSVLFVAEAHQNIHRINIFADVVWAFLAAVIAAIGLHGLCVNSKQN